LNIVYFLFTQMMNKCSVYGKNLEMFPLDKLDFY
jgi:hypothetical protein